MKLETFTDSHITELESWFKVPIEGNRFIDYYKDVKTWLRLVQSRPERRAFVATLSSEVVGFVDIEFDDEGDVSFAFGLKPSVRGKGLGKRLLDAVLRYAKAQNAKTIKAGVDKQNVTCRKLLESADFSPVTDDDNITEYIKELNLMSDYRS